MIEAGHTEESERLDDICTCISDPEEIYQSKTSDRSFCVFNYSFTSPGGDPIRAVVKKVSDEEAILSTAHYHASGDRGELLWSANTGGQDEEE